MRLVAAEDEEPSRAGDAPDLGIHAEPLLARGRRVPPACTLAPAASAYTLQVASAASFHDQRGGAGAGRRAASAAAIRPRRSPTSLSVTRSCSTSRTAGTSNAQTGVPQASASTGGNPKPSSSLGNTSAWAPV